MHVGEGWGGVLVTGERPGRVASFSCTRPWGPSGGILAVVYETVGERCLENAELIESQVVPEVFGSGLTEDGDPRRNLRSGWTRLTQKIGDPRRNHVSFLLVHANADRLFCARAGGGKAQFVNWRESNPLMSYYDVRLQAHRISNESKHPLLLLGTPGIWERLPIDYVYAREVFRAFGQDGIPAATASLEGRLLAHPRPKGTYAGVLIDLTPFHRPEQGS